MQQTNLILIKYTLNKVIEIIAKLRPISFRVSISHGNNAKCSLILYLKVFTGILINHFISLNARDDGLAWKSTHELQSTAQHFPGLTKTLHGVKCTKYTLREPPERHKCEISVWSPSTPHHSAHNKPNATKELVHLLKIKARVNSSKTVLLLSQPHPFPGARGTAAVRNHTRWRSKWLCKGIKLKAREKHLPRDLLSTLTTTACTEGWKKLAFQFHYFSSLQKAMTILCIKHSNHLSFLVLL